LHIPFLSLRIIFKLEKSKCGERRRDEFFACNWISFLPSSFPHAERAVRLGDAPTVNSVKRGARLQGRSEVRFLTFPPFFY